MSKNFAKIISHKQIFGKEFYLIINKNMKILIWTTILLFINSFGTIAQTNQISQCPTISVIGPSSFPNPDELVTYTANVSEEANKYPIKFSWSVNGGQIIEGQGTSIIKTTWKNSKYVFVATVKIEGLPENCANTFSEVMHYEPAPQAEKIDEISDKTTKFEDNRTDKIIKDIKENPSAQLFVLIYSKNIQTLTDEVQIIKNMLLKDNKTLADHLTFVKTVSSKEKIEFWLVPAGAAPPEIEKDE